MKICALGTGSRGNSIAVWEGESGLLIDAGLSFKQTLARMGDNRINPRWFRHVLITHSHGDHHTCVRSWVEKHGARVVCTKATFDRTPNLGGYPGSLLQIQPKKAERIGGWKIMALPVVHNSPGAVTFMIQSPEKKRLASITETGVVTEDMVTLARDADAVILEANHDSQMCAMNDSRPGYINERTMAGHLNNDQAYEVLSGLGNRAKVVILVHLSSDNNDPLLVRRHMDDANRSRGRNAVRVVISEQDKATEVYEV